MYPLFLPRFFLFFIECFQSIQVYFGDQTETVFIKKNIYFFAKKTRLFKTGLQFENLIEMMQVFYLL